MIPGTYDIEITRGDTFYIPQITISSLAAYGGPATLNLPAVVTANVYHKGETFSMSVDYLDRAAGEISLSMAPTVTSRIPDAAGGEASWDLEVENSGWVGTILKGSATVYPEI